MDAAKNRRPHNPAYGKLILRNKRLLADIAFPPPPRGRVDIGYEDRGFSCAARSRCGWHPHYRLCSARAVPYFNSASQLSDVCAIA